MFYPEVLKYRHNPHLKFEQIHKTVSEHARYLANLAKSLKHEGDDSNCRMVDTCVQSMLEMQAIIHDNYQTEKESERTADILKELKDLRGQMAYREEGLTHLKERNQTLEHENVQLSHRVEELMTRISQMMSSQEVDRKDAHENLMDKNRPSAIAQRCRCLYREQYGEISAEMQEVDYEEQSIADNLLKIFMMAMKKTKKEVEKVKEEIFSKLQDLFNSKPFQGASKKRALSKHLVDDVCMMLREVPDPVIIENLQKEIYSRCLQVANRGGNIKRHLVNYINDCVEVAWLMNASNPPMFVAADDFNYGPEKHSKFSGHGSQVQYYLWPCLYFSEEVYQQNGNVMAKGDVVLQSTKKTASASKQEEKTKGKQISSESKEQREAREKEQRDREKLEAQEAKRSGQQDPREFQRSNSKERDRYASKETNSAFNAEEEQRKPVPIKELTGNQETFKTQNKSEKIPDRGNNDTNNPTVARNSSTCTPYQVVPPITSQPTVQMHVPGKALRYDNSPSTGRVGAFNSNNRSNRTAPYSVKIPSTTPKTTTSRLQSQNCDIPEPRAISSNLCPRLDIQDESPESRHRRLATLEAHELVHWNENRKESYVVVESPSADEQNSSNTSYASVASTRAPRGRAAPRVTNQIVTRSNMEPRSPRY